VRSATEYDQVTRLIEAGRDDCAVSRLTGVPRTTVRDWRIRRRARGADPDCPGCSSATVDPQAYAYLLGLYLGDGYIAAHRRGVYRLRITLDARYPRIIDECVEAMRAVSHSRSILTQRRTGCVEVGAYWKHWPCLFPHGPGRKHSRRIVLLSWQRRLAALSSDRLLRGLIHSDGCRISNRVGQRSYLRYYFTNLSSDILDLFCTACDALGVAWTRPTSKQISIARSASVARLDAFVGPKT
jgi:hypothetical protein